MIRKAKEPDGWGPHWGLTFPEEVSGMLGLDGSRTQKGGCLPSQPPHSGRVVKTPLTPRSEVSGKHRCYIQNHDCYLTLAKFPPSRLTVRDWGDFLKLLSQSLGTRLRDAFCEKKTFPWVGSLMLNWLQKRENKGVQENKHPTFLQRASFP